MSLSLGRLSFRDRVLGFRCLSGFCGLGLWDLWELSLNPKQGRGPPATVVGGRRLGPCARPPFHSHRDRSTHVVPGTGTRSCRDQDS